MDLDGLDLFQNQILVCSNYWQLTAFLIFILVSSRLTADPYDDDAYAYDCYLRCNAHVLEEMSTSCAGHIWLHVWSGSSPCTYANIVSAGTKRGGVAFYGCLKLTPQNANVVRCWEEMLSKPTTRDTRNVDEYKEYKVMERPHKMTLTGAIVLVAHSPFVHRQVLSAARTSCAPAPRNYSTLQP